MASRVEPQKGTSTRSARVSPYDVRNTALRAHRDNGRSPLRGIVFLAVLAAVVIGAAYVIVPPMFAGVARGMVSDNPDAIRLPFVGDVVRADLGEKLTKSVSTDDSPVPFVVPANATVSQIADQLARQRLISDPLVFHYLVITGRQDTTLRAGSYTLNQAMTPEQIVARLQLAPDPAPTNPTIGLREGLRIEQVTALLQTTELELDVREFYELASEPPADLTDDYGFLETLPEGASLEGFFPGGTYEVDPETSAEELVRRLLDEWATDYAPQVLQAALDAEETLGYDFYEIMTIASIVERETAVDEERPLIAGVYLNRLDEELNSTLLMNADPAVIWAKDTVELEKIDLEEWPNYAFWTLVGTALAGYTVPAELQGYQTYQTPGLIPGPIDSPSIASIEAVIEADRADGYLFFVAKCDDSGEHAFAKTLREHQNNVNACR